MRNRRNRLRTGRIRKKIIILLLIIAIGFVAYEIARTLAIYTSSAEVEGTLDVGFWFVEAGYQDNTIFVNNVFPSTSYYEYPFSVSNNNGTKTADVDIEYVIKLKTTTNLPLNYNLYKKVSSTTGIPATDLYNDGTNNYRKISCVEVQTPSLSSNYSILDQDTDGTYYKEFVYVFGYDNNKFIMEYGDEITDEYIILVEFPISYKTVPEYQDIIDYIKLSVEAKQIIE